MKFTYTIAATLALSCEAVTLTNTMEAAADATTAIEATTTIEAELQTLLDTEAMAGGVPLDQKCPRLKLLVDAYKLHIPPNKHAADY